jgi:hypothetical protein
MEYWSVGVLVRSLGGDSFKIPLLHYSTTPSLQETLVTGLARL